jgi:hypothetical protein
MVAFHDAQRGNKSQRASQLEFVMLLDNKKVGALLRVFAKEPKLVAGAVEQTLDLAKKLATVEVVGKKMVSHVQILIPRDERYADVDCGETADALRKALRFDDWAHGRVFVAEVQKGDIFCGVLNLGMSLLAEQKCAYGIVASKEAGSYFNGDTAATMVKAAEDGALAIGIAISELTESVMQGRIANTLGMWEIRSLQQVGGFDLKSAKPKKDAVISHKVRAWNDSREVPSWSYDLAGVEEIIPLCRLVDTFGECIAPILPQGEGVQQYIVPDLATDPAGYMRHLNKMGTKRERQTYFANSEDADLSFIAGGVLPAYRTQPYFT